jgi:hypothetical protein
MFPFTGSFGNRSQVSYFSFHCFSFLSQVLIRVVEVLLGFFESCSLIARFCMITPCFPLLTRRYLATCRSILNLFQPFCSLIGAMYPEVPYFGRERAQGLVVFELVRLIFWI